MAASAPQTVAFAIGGPLTRGDLPGLCQRICALLERTDADVVLCDVTTAGPNAVTVDALARVHLAARQHGCGTRLRGASSELIELLDFAGLRDVL